MEYLMWNAHFAFLRILIFETDSERNRSIQCFPGNLSFESQIGYIAAVDKGQFIFDEACFNFMKSYFDVLLEGSLPVEIKEN